ncbi:hypothetical protein ACFY3N_20335 [Streptomyces sp. NPDC000348]|uniref:hypothetical protein n=1 Tax=Streptomyces sp. NPDC000348 TaxID=3364538 RepID=UPI0036BAFCC7
MRERKKQLRCAAEQQRAEPGARRPVCAGCGTRLTDERWKATEPADWDAGPEADAGGGEAESVPAGAPGGGNDRIGGELEALGACAALLLEAVAPDQVPRGRDSASAPVLLGRERDESFAQVAGSHDAIGDLDNSGASERVDVRRVGAVGTGAGSVVDGQVPVDGRGERAPPRRMARARCWTPTAATTSEPVLLPCAPKDIAPSGHAPPTIRACVDGFHVRAKEGEPRPVDRRKTGSGHHLIYDGKGTTLHVSTTEHPVSRPCR